MVLGVSRNAPKALGCTLLSLLTQRQLYKKSAIACFHNCDRTNRMF
ncbi:MAG: hypothetical protein ACRAVC_12600 [Trichormus sp.]